MLRELNALEYLYRYELPAQKGLVSSLESRVLTQEIIIDLQEGQLIDYRRNLDSLQRATIEHMKVSQEYIRLNQRSIKNLRLWKGAAMVGIGGMISATTVFLLLK